MTGPRPMCHACTRLTAVSPAGGRCDAFPDGIPERIYWRGGDHTVPVDGDRGLRFQQRPGAKAPVR